MNKNVLILLGILLLISFSISVFYKTKKLDDTKIYFFSQKGCHHCIEAKKFLENNYKDLNIEILELDELKNMNLFFKCVEKFDLDKKTLGTPLICIGNNYILGWSKNKE